MRGKQPPLFLPEKTPKISPLPLGNITPGGYIVVERRRIEKTMKEQRRYEVEMHKRVEQALEKLPKQTQVSFIRLAEELKTNPRPRRKGFYPIEKDKHRGRLGRKHRVHWMIDDEKRTVTIVRVGAREGM